MSYVSTTNKADYPQEYDVGDYVAVRIKGGGRLFKKVMIVAKLRKAGAQWEYQLKDKGGELYQDESGKEKWPTRKSLDVRDKIGKKAATDPITTPVNQYAQGYPRLAAFNASEQNHMLYRGFSYVHSRLLLDLQTELSELEKKLYELDEEDELLANTNSETKKSPLRSQLLDVARARRQPETTKGTEGQQSITKEPTRRDILQELHKKLLKYDELLIKAREVVSFQRPTDRDYRNVTTWFSSERPLVQREEEYILWREDLVSLRHGQEWAGFDGKIEATLDYLKCDLIERVFGRPGRRHKDERELNGKPLNGQVTYFSASRVEKLVGLIITTLVVILLVIPVIAMLSLGKHNPVFSAIGIMIGFTLLFAATMSLLTKARTHELFSASAAYCAVLIVFIANFNSPNGQGVQ
ncbi:uncharacterized protein K452DRAFT_329409 [Aplosporella prunicola CBS 121167]|uniref:DUF6594 domain-containing protein n=1 Tax=Aplosporella prunicola CBS 121167 TaxID=1176127 RepID=A0A6A6B2Y7_9PEZI|nr:uncharacterized protein K452DRAFT_329409 [Aplosporella prunicola CBS 121167]KAF2137091.1 hypothetical protein K452DRAFT_329409 [Aplosporella prunicola CBS 121167]